MEAGWHFNQPQPGDKNREPVQGEFFATEAIKNAAEALVREGIQNSLDAGLQEKTVKVRIYISGEDGALSEEIANKYLDGAWPHIQAAGNGLVSPANPGDICPFIVFEDFNTTGLDGDPEQWHDEAGVKNSFYYFFRAEGQSSKGEKDRGRWGVGKTVFPRSSNISSYFGLTVRSSDGQAMLMGQSVLKSHFIENDYFSPDGYWGLRPDRLTLPITDLEVIDQFSRDFRLKRALDESGLSVVIPYCDTDLTNEAIVAAVCKDYFYPILASKLEVIVESLDSRICIDSDTVRDVALSVAEKLPHGYSEIIDLAEWATTLPTQQMVKCGDTNPPFPPEWSKSLLSYESATEIHSRLENGEKVAIRVYLKVAEKGRSPQKTFFDVFLKRAGSYDSIARRPIFVRDGIIISDVKGPKTRGFFAIVVVQDQALATLLGDSENPAHTQWQRHSSHFKGKYKYAAYYIPFVTRSVHEIVNLVVKEEDTTDPSLFVDFFSLAIQQSGTAKAEKPHTKQNVKESLPVPHIPVTPAPVRFRVNSEPGGFIIKPSSIGIEPPQGLHVRVAYDTRHGSPLAKYNPVDFVMGELDIELSGAEVCRMTNNELVLEITEDDFEISVKGFDSLRDLYVDVKPREVLSDTSV